MRVAVIGTGNVGGALAQALSASGHEVVAGSRRAGRSVGSPESIPVLPVAEALDAADVVVLAVPGDAVEDIVGEHAAVLEGRLVIDAANRIGGPGPLHSAAVLAEHAPGARYARAFNTLGWESFADPVFGRERGDLFFSAREEDRATVAQIIGDVGLRPVYVGAGQEDLLDGVLRLWFALAVGQGRGRHLAFKVLDDSGTT